MAEEFCEGFKVSMGLDAQYRRKWVIGVCDADAPRIVATAIPFVFLFVVDDSFVHRLPAAFKYSDAPTPTPNPTLGFSLTGRPAPLVKANNSAKVADFVSDGGAP